MVVIISGQRDCGKTTWCRENLSTETTTGILLVKVYQESLCVGYDVVRLGAGDRIPFMRIRRAAYRNLAASGLSRPGGVPPGGVPPDWDPGDEIGQFAISARGLLRATEWIRESAGDPSKNILVDEVGRLELEGRGFSSAVESAVKTAGMGRTRTLYLVVRETFVRNIMKHFAIEEAEVIEIDNGAVRSRSAVRS